MLCLSNRKVSIGPWPNPRLPLDKLPSRIKFVTNAINNEKVSYFRRAPPTIKIYVFIPKPTAKRDIKMEDKGYLPKFKWGNLNATESKMYYDFILGALTLRNKLPITKNYTRDPPSTWQIKPSICELFCAHLITLNQTKHLWIYLKSVQKYLPHFLCAFVLENCIWRNSNINA